MKEMTRNVKITESREETQKAGERLGASLNKGEIIALYGELGSGKTTFVQGLAKGLGLSKKIPSPSFVIVRHYPLKRKKLENFYHIDLYRIDDYMVQDLGLKEIFDNPLNVIAVEWAEKLGNLLPEKRWDAVFEYLSENKRKITINYFNSANQKQ